MRSWLSWFRNTKIKHGSSDKPSAEKLVTRFLLAEPEAHKPEKTFHVLGQLILVRIVILSIFLGTSTWAVISSETNTATARLIFFTLGATYAISLLNSLLIRWKLNSVLLGYGQLTVDVVLSTLAIHATASPVSVSLYLVVIMGAAVVFGRHGAVILAALCGLSYSLLTAGILPFANYSVPTSPQDVFGVYCSLVAIALISSYFANQLEQIGSLANITQKNLSDLSMQQQQLLDDMSEGIITLDLHSTITGINQAARSIVGLTSLSSHDFIGRRFSTVFEEQGVVGVESMLKEDMKGSIPGDLTLSFNDSERRLQVNYSVRHVQDSDGNTIGKIILFNDVSHVRSMEERLLLHEKMAELLATNEQQDSSSSEKYHSIQLVGDSPVMQTLFTLVDRVSQTDASVLITGESGTGKELIARAIHTHGSRAHAPFVAINCSAIPESLIESELFGHKKGSFTGAVSDNLGLFRQAQGGTMFLDEIGELPVHLQTKLLRALQERTIRPVGDTRDYPIDVRIIAATNRDLKREIKAESFREDLFYRLNVVNIVIPPLRERKEDIPLLVRHFIGRHSDPHQILPKVSPESLSLLMAYGFPGNIRELENVIERALVLGGQAILPEHLPDEIRECKSKANGSSADSERSETQILVLPVDLETVLQELERNYLDLALSESGGVKKQAAELLGLNFRSFRYRLKKYGMAEASSQED